ncbi:RNA polymerase sigma factor [Paenibacillus hemerocallicola]|uniref:RNA polymerase sigma factor n=1 Tax=Paenibacillus hemerocallicola TaxID=1172614 RepID=A0A5C4T2T9_9BACL|nr:RNA polymerase sigma factor [Paenibacillus hemerocallicola]TNJ62587.1 RNA polymerase sigma factor [Paenibacillus hemerocallicola]
MNIDELIELVKLHGKSIYGFCYKLTRNKEETDDLYQETFLRAVELRFKMNASHNPKAYLLSIAVRVYKNHYRKLSRRQRIAPIEELDEDSTPSRLFPFEASPEDAVLMLERRALIQQAVHQLDDKLKLPLYMHYTADMTVEEIANALSIPTGTVKSRMHNARQAIKKALEVESL